MHDIHKTDSSVHSNQSYNVYSKTFNVDAYLQKWVKLVFVISKTCNLLWNSPHQHTFSIIVAEVTETAKEGINTGIESVKEAVGTAVNTAEHSIGNVVSKIGDTFNSKTNAAKQTIESTKGVAEAAYDKTSSMVGEKVAEGVDGAERAVLTRMKSVEEAVAETQTTMASKIDEMKEAVSTRTFGQLQNEVNESFNKTKESLKESLHIDDLDQDFDVLDEKVKDFEAKTDDLIESLPSVLRGRLPTPAPSSPPVEEKQEE